MSKARLEAFSDGVFAVLITILVLELKVPSGSDWAALGPVLPVFSAYCLSFIFLGIYWNNHHHMLHVTSRVTGGILWANLHLLFWLSLVPFATGWLGENHLARLPTAIYGVVLFFAAVAFTLLLKLIIRDQGARSPLRDAVGRDRKGQISLVLYAIAIALTWVTCWISVALYAGVALMWLVPDRRIESKVHDEPASHK